MYSIHKIASVIRAHTHLVDGRADIEYLVFDSRNLQQPSRSLFFCLITPRADGHQYIADAYEKGVRNFVVSKQVDVSFKDVNLLRVEDTLAAMQELASWHRSHFTYPVIGLTGSNGKTIVKEWLYQLLESHFSIVRSPRSFNSQIGVPLSVWAMRPEHQLAIIEAGISQPGEMVKLEAIIHPSIAVITNIGAAHDAQFSSRSEKMREKLALFQGAQMAMGPHALLERHLPAAARFTWGAEPGSSLRIIRQQQTGSGTLMEAVHGQRILNVEIPFTDEASIQNAICCWAIMLYLGVSEDVIVKGLRSLQAMEMRMQLQHSINQCMVINDSYSMDITSLQLALGFMDQQGAGLRKTLILSEFAEHGFADKELYDEIAGLIQLHQVKRVIVIGERLDEGLSGRLQADVSYEGWLSTEDFLHHFRSSQFQHEIILVKGARRFGFERIARLFERRLHQTVMEINLNAIEHNFRYHSAMLPPGVGIMAMVKAFGYGSGGAEIAGVLQYNHVKYLGVAYADEGIELAKAGISLPVMVMNTEESSYASIVDHHLQPVIYSMEMLRQFESFLKDQGLQAYPVHIEIETGMNRLGFKPEEVQALALHLSLSNALSIVSVFSHLAASEDPSQDSFTIEQDQRLEMAVNVLKEHLAYSFLTHIANSAAIIRHPRLGRDMVRLGIGLYGVDGAGGLQHAVSLRSTIAQLRQVGKHETVSYNRRGKLDRDSLIATIRIGYADGYSRRFGHGRGYMLIRGQKAPVVGTVCMDMTMVDVTDIPGVSVNDDVIVFGSTLTVSELASMIETIPYEILTSVSQRVPRLYFRE